MRFQTTRGTLTKEAETDSVSGALVEDKYFIHFLQTHFNLLMELFECLVCKTPFHPGDESIPGTILKHHLTHQETKNMKSWEVYKCVYCSAYFITLFPLSNYKDNIN